MANVGAVSIDLEPTGYGNYTGDIQVDLVDVSGVALTGIVGAGVVEYGLWTVIGYAGSHGAVVCSVDVLGAGMTSYFGNAALNIASVISADGMAGFLGSGEVDIDTAVALTAFWSVVGSGVIEVNFPIIAGVGRLSGGTLGIVLRFKTAMPGTYGNGVIRMSVSVEASD